MISNPKNGWCEFKLEEFSGRPSNVTNIPVDLLEAFINYWETGEPVNVSLNEEDIEFILYSSEDGTYVIEEKDYPKTHICDKTIKDLTKELIDDIDEELPEWETFTQCENCNNNHVRGLLEQLRDLYRKNK